MASIFDVFGRLLLEDSQAKAFVSEARKTGEQAGDAVGKSMGQRITAGLKTSFGVGARLVAVGAAGVFGIAAKGALELENATARYRAETGATAEEAKRAGATINRVAGEQRQSLEAVTEVAIRVKRDMGAVGAEADKLTGQFVAFARVTRQDAGAAVSAFDDILDSWGLQASQAGEIMDKLLVSNQKFGGTLSETQATLAALAPAFRAANFQIDDAIALLGLFGSKGIDANVGAAAFAKALTKVKSPAELKALIADISATVNPFDRARKAADLFGAKAGAKLANALQGANLDDYKIGMEEAAGATQKAADVLDSTFTAQLQKKISEAGAALRQFGTDFGPLLTGTAALASLGGSLGLDKVLGKAFGKLAGSAVVKGAAKAAALQIGLVFSGYMFLADKLGSALGSVLSGLPGAGAVKSAVGGLGKFLGSSLGKASAVAFAAILWVEVFDTYNKVKAGLAEQTAQIGKDVQAQVAAGTTASLEQSKAALEQGLKDINGVWDAGLFTTDSRKSLEQQLAAVNAELEKRSSQMGPTVAAGLSGGKDDVSAGATDMVSGIDDSVTQAAADAKKAAEKTPLEIAAGLRDKRSAVQAAIAQLHDDIQNQLTRTGEAAGLAGALIGKELAGALKSKDPVVKAQAQATKQLIIDRLVELAGQGGPLGKKAMDELNKGIKSKNPQTRAAAATAKKAVEDKLAAIEAKKKGEEASAHLAAGLKTPAGQQAVLAAVKTLADIVLGFLRLITGGATNTKVSGGGGGSGPKALAAGGHLDAGEPAIVGDAGRPELWVPDVPGTVLPRVPAAAGAVTASQTNQFDITVNPGNDVSPGAAHRFGQAVADEVAKVLQEQNSRFTSRLRIARA